MAVHKSAAAPTHQNFKKTFRPPTGHAANLMMNQRINNNQLIQDMKKYLLCVIAMVCVSIGAWAHPIPGGGEVNVENGVATFHNVTAGMINDHWTPVSNHLSGVTRIKFDNTCSINQADLERFLQGNTYYVDLFDITNGSGAKMKVDDYTTTADDNNADNIDMIIEKAVANMVTNGWQAKGIILPLNTGSGTAKVEMANSNGGETFTEYAVYYRDTQKTAAIYAHDGNMRYSWEYNNANTNAQNHYETAYAHLTSHSEVAEAETYIVSTNNKKRGSDDGLDLSNITGNVTKISIINDELVYKNQTGRSTLAGITVEGVEAGAFAAAVANTGLKSTPCEKLIVQGPVNGDDVKAVNDFTTAEGPLIYSLEAATGVTKDMLPTITNNKLEYLVLPYAMAAEQIVASDFSDALTASTNTNFKAAIAPSANGKKLSAYVKEAGSLVMARYYATGGSFNNNQYTPTTTGLTEVILSGNLNARDIAAQLSNLYISDDGHWTTSYTANSNALNGEQSTIVSFDLENAVFANQYDMNFNKAGYEGLTNVVFPTSEDMTIIPADCVRNNKSLTSICVPYNYKKIENGAFWDTMIDHITTTDRNGAEVDNGPLSWTLSANLEELGIAPSTAGGSVSTTVFPQNTGVQDIYILATTPPLCYKDVFPANSQHGWGGYDTSKPYSRDRYFNAGDPLKSWAVLHYPSKESYKAITGSENGYQQMMELYTDVNKVFTKKEQTGAVDANGNPVAWPSHYEAYRAYNQASAGYTWNDWGVDYVTGNTDGWINGGANTNRPYDGGDEQIGSATKVGDYDFTNYEGWHQIVLSMATYVEPDEIIQDEKIVREYEEAGWYTFCIPFNMTYEQVVEMLGVPKSTDKVINKLNGVVQNDDVMPDIRQLHSVTRKKGTGSQNNIVFLRLTRNLYDKSTGHTDYLEFNNNATPQTITYSDAQPSNQSYSMGTQRCLVGGRPYVIKAYKRKKINEAGVDEYKIPGQNIAKAILTRYADQFGADASCVMNGLYEQLGNGDLLTLRFAKPYEEHKVQAVRDGEGSAYLTYDNNGNTYKYYYTMIGQFWQQPLPQYCLYMSRGDWYRYTDTSKGYTWDPYKCVIMATQEIEASAVTEGPAVGTEGYDFIETEPTVLRNHMGGKFRDFLTSKFPKVQADTKDLLKWNFELRFLNGRDDDDFDGNGTSAKFMFVFDDDIVEIDDEGNEFTAIEMLDGEMIMPVNARVYNMSGQYVGNSLEGLSKGLYIVNGKKYIVK